MHHSYYLWLNVLWGSSHWILSLELLLKCVSFIADGKRFQGNKSVPPVSVISRSCLSTWYKTPSAFTYTNHSTVILWCSVFLFCTCYQEADLHCVFCCFLVWAWNFFTYWKAWILSYEIWVEGWILLLALTTVFAISIASSVIPCGSFVLSPEHPPAGILP